MIFVALKKPSLEQTLNCYNFVQNENTNIDNIYPCSVNMMMNTEKMQSIAKPKEQKIPMQEQQVLAKLFNC